MPADILRFISTLCFFTVFSLLTLQGLAQEGGAPEEGSLENIVKYALQHQPILQQASIDESITDKQIKGQLANWYPQINFSLTGQRFADLQSSVIGGNVIKLGLYNTSSLQFSFNQTIFNRDVLLASKTASKVRIQSLQNTNRIRTNVAGRVMKAYYNVLISYHQVKLSEESLERLKQSLDNAKKHSESGFSDQTDFKRATILLANARVSLKANQEIMKLKQLYLKEMMGYPLDKVLAIQFDSGDMEKKLVVDTTHALNYINHIDYKILNTQRELQNASIQHSRWAFLPKVNAFGAYNLNYQNDDISNLYRTKYPFSYLGFTLTIPVFQGGKRIAEVQEQKLKLQRIDLDVRSLQQTLNTEYATALGTFKSNLTNFKIQKQNTEIARELYNIIQLQHKNGLKNYLEVTIAEGELNTTRINYYNSLYQLLASQVDIHLLSGQIIY